MSDRCVWIVHCRRAMHECWRTERRLARITEIDVCAEIVLELLREAEREFVEKIVRMLAVVQCLAVATIRRFEIEADNRVRLR